MLAPSSTTNLIAKAKLLRGLADPSRLAILESLRSGPRNVCEIVTETALTQPNVSNHLGCLRECGLVTRAEDGRFARYALTAEPSVESLLAVADAVSRALNDNLSDCRNYRRGA